MQTAWFSTSCSSRPSLASSASFLWTGTPAGGSGSGWRPTDVLTVSLIKSSPDWVTVQLKSLWTLVPAEFVYLSSREIWILKMQERDKQLRLQRKLTPRQTITRFNFKKKTHNNITPGYSFFFLLWLSTDTKNKQSLPASLILEVFPFSQPIYTLTFVVNSKKQDVSHGKYCVDVFFLFSSLISHTAQHIGSISSGNNTRK